MRLIIITSLLFALSLPGMAQRTKINAARDVTGTLPVTNGGTGQTTQQAAIDALVPAQTGNSGKCLSTDGTTVSWAVCGGGSGTLAIEANGSAVGSEATLNFITGTGISEMVTDAGTKINKTTAVDTAVMLTRAQAQSGADLLCSPASASGANYTCSMTPALGSYTTGMVVNFVPDVNSSAGAVTLNINSVGSLNVKQADGTTDPGAAGLKAGQRYPIWFDGTVLRMPEAGGGGASALDDLSDVTITTPAVRETLFNNGSGQFVNRVITAADLPALPFVKAITVESPTASEDITLFFTDDAITITQLNAVIAGTGTPSVTWTIRFASDRSAAGTEVVTGGTATTSTSTGSEVTSFTDATIPAGSWVWLKTTAMTTATMLNVTIEYTRD